MAWRDTIAGTLILLSAGVIGHAIHDLILFTNLRRDVKWMKAEMRKHGMTAPNGDSDE